MRSLVFALLLLSGHACKHICSDDAKCEQSLGRPTEKFEKYGKESYALSHSATPYNGDFIRELNFVQTKTFRLLFLCLAVGLRQETTHGS